MNRSLFILASLLVLFVAGCTSPAPQSGAPSPASVQAPASTPLATSVVAPTTAPQALPSSTPGVLPPPPETRVLPASCYREGLPTFVSKGLGICFAYPQGFALGDVGNGQPNVIGPALDSSADPLRASLTIQVRPASGKTLPDLISMYSVETGTSVETRLGDVTLDGEKARVIDPTQGRPNARTALVLQNDKLVILSFAPTLKETPASQQNATWQKGEKDMQALYEIVTSSFAFLDKPRQVGANDTIGVPGNCVQTEAPFYIDADSGYCFAFPPRFTVGEVNPGQRAIFGPALDKSPDPVRASLFVEVKPAPSGADLATLVEEFVKANPALPIKTTQSDLGGKPAVMLTNVPGLTTSTNWMALSGGKLYNLWLQPADREQAKADVNELTGYVIKTWGWMPHQ